MSPIVIALTLFILALIIGVTVIGRVPATLHTPLMSGANSIHGVVLIGVILVAANSDSLFGYIVIFFAALLGTLNVVGGYVVTDRMLEMFKPKSNDSSSKENAESNLDANKGVTLTYSQATSQTDANSDSETSKRATNKTNESVDAKAKSTPSIDSNAQEIEKKANDRIAAEADLDALLASIKAKKGDPQKSATKQTVARKTPAKTQSKATVKTSAKSSVKTSSKKVVKATK